MSIVKEDCIYYKDGDCQKGLLGTPCDVVGCAAMIPADVNIFTTPDTRPYDLRHGPFEKDYQTADAMKALDEKIKKVSERGTWDGVDVDKYIAELRGRDTELQKAASDLVDAVERYTKPEKGQFCHRSELINVKNKLKELLKDE